MGAVFGQGVLDKGPRGQDFDQEGEGFYRVLWTVRAHAEGQC